MVKRITLFMVLLLVSSLVFIGCGTKDLTKGKTGEEILEEAYTKMSAIENYDMNIKMKMKMQPPGQEVINMDVQGTATVFQKPMRLKMIMDMDAQGQQMNLEQYMEQTETGMVIYQNIENQWYKMVIEDLSFAEMMNMDPSKSLTLYLENLEKAEVLGEETIGEKDTVKLEMVVSSKMYDEIMNQMPGANITGQLPLDPGIFSKIGEIKGIIWVDKATLDIVKTSMDMTENIRKLGKALVESGSMPKEAAEVFTSMEMSMEYEVVNHNNAEQFTIPEAAKNAQEMPLP